mmetsp:Transcript_10528/g.20238  ORF Transcript_10528/g.20238 Transcript_10528/m.20238 type:complete len:229 (-) Transcript_10528:95-781(-)
MWCFLVNYALSLCLFILAELETSNFISLLYSFVAMTLFYKAVLTKPLQDLLSSKNLIVFNFLQFLSGIRIALICKNLVYSYIQGIVMMVVAIFRSYKSRDKHFSFYFASFSLVVSFIVFSICIKSPLMFIIGILFLFWMLASEIMPGNKVYAIIVLVVLCGLGLFTLNMDFGLLFNSIEQSLQRVEGLNKLLVLMKDPDILIPEKRLATEGLLFVKAKMLSLQTLTRT